MNKNEYKVYIRIHDFKCNPDDITKELLLTPTNAWSKGDIIPNRKGVIKRKQSTWELKSSLSESKPVENHIEFLLNQISSNMNGFKNVIGRCSGELSIVMYLYDDFNPGINIDKETVEKIADLGLEIDFDIYFLSPLWS